MRSVIVLILSVLMISAYAQTKSSDASNLLKGQIENPYSACKNQTFVKKDAYDKNRSCDMTVVPVDGSFFSSIESLEDASSYLSLSKMVAEKILSNLDKSRKYAQSSAECFKSQSKDDFCTERRSEVLQSLKVNSRKIRMELALSTDAPGLSGVNINNALIVDPDKRINTNLRDFELSTPNPVGRSDMTARELKEAKRRVRLDYDHLKEEAKNQGLNPNSDIYEKWMSTKLMKKFEEHQAKYRQLIYEEAPIFSVIGRPKKIVNGEEPVWSDEDISKAFVALDKNAKKTEARIQNSLKDGTLEFSRLNGSALLNWVEGKSDLLYFMGMKNQVEEVLAEHPELCGMAITMYNRIKDKNLQNSGMVLGANLVAIPFTSGPGVIVSRLFFIGRALTGAEAAGLTGLALGTVTLGDQYRQYKTVKDEAATRSGLGSDEGSALISAEDIDEKLSALKLTVGTMPMTGLGSYGLGKTLYQSLSKQMAKDIPGIGSVIKSSTLTNATRDKIVDLWFAQKISTLTREDQALLNSENGKKVLTRLALELEKKDPEYFRDPKKVGYFFEKAVFELKKFYVGDLLSVTTESYPAYSKTIVTAGKSTTIVDPTPLKYAARYEVSPELPRLMLLRSSEDGIHEMREFGGNARYFKMRREGDNQIWEGVDLSPSQAKNLKWKESVGSSFETKPEVAVIDYSKMDRSKLIEEMKNNIAAASKTARQIHNVEASVAKAASDNLDKSLKYLLDLNDKKTDLTIEHIQKLHGLMSDGAMWNSERDVAVGILRGDAPKIVQRDGKNYLVDLSDLSLRMGEQKVMSYTAPKEVRKEVQEILDRVNKVNPNTPPAEIAEVFVKVMKTHGFVDGNGRLGRTLLQYMLVKKKAPLKMLEETETFMSYYMKPEEMGSILFSK